MPEKQYSLEEANWLVETVQKQMNWSYSKLAEELGVSARFMRYFRTGERTSYPIYERLAKLSKKPPIPPPPPKVKIEVHPFVAEEETREFFSNLGKYLISRGTAPHRKMQGEPVQLTLADFMKFEEKKGKIIENFADWLVDTAEETLQRVYRSTKPMKGKSKIKRKFEDISSITEKEEVRGAIESLGKVEEKYRPKIFTIAGEKAETMAEFGKIIEESYKDLKDFFGEVTRHKREFRPGESMTYTRAYLKDLGLSPKEIEEYRVVKAEE